MSETKNLPAQIQQTTSRPPSVFSGAQAFEDAQRMAKALCASSLVPKDYQGNTGIPNAMIALEMAQRVGASPLAVMQNMHVIHGRPSWSSSFIIASLNSCGRFSPVRFVVEGDGDKKTCYAWAYDATGEKLTGPPASIAMAKAEGWLTKNGSKWQTMPDLMLRYRAAAFFGRLYAPDILMGMHSDDEAQDIGPQQRQAATVAPVLVEDVPEAVEEIKPETDKEDKPKTTAKKSSKKKPEPEEIVEAEIEEAEPETEQAPPPLAEPDDEPPLPDEPEEKEEDDNLF